MVLRVLFFVFLFVFISPVSSFAKENEDNAVCYEHLMPVQKRINEIGFKILNANKLAGHIVFSYNEKNKLIKEDAVLKRQIVVYGKNMQQAENDDELAAYLAREISVAVKSFDGSLGGFISTMQIKMAPKKYELVADKRAVDYLVKAGYNPLALITLINKTCPQGRQDKISKHNLTSKRLMYIYEKIYFDYPYFLVNNPYIKNDYYQNFLLTSIENRRKLQESARKNERGRADYE